MNKDRHRCNSIACNASSGVCGQSYDNLGFESSELAQQSSAHRKHTYSTHNLPKNLHYIDSYGTTNSSLDHLHVEYCLQRKKSVHSLSNSIKDRIECIPGVEREPQSWDGTFSQLCCLFYQKFARILCLLLLGLLIWSIVYSILGKEVAPGGPLFTLVAVAVTAYFAGWLVSLTNMPALIGMLLAGIVLRNTNVMTIDQQYNHIISNLRKMSLMIILTRAGLGLDPEAMKSIKMTVPKINLISWATEASIIMATSYFFMGLPLIWGFLAGTIITAVSLAVIVPSLFRLRNEGYGIAKGIPTLIIALAGVDNVISITIFGILESIMFSDDELWYQVLHGPIAIIGGVSFGIVWGILARYIPKKDDPYLVSLRVLMLLGAGMISIFGSEQINLRAAGPVAVVAAAFASSYFWQKEGWGASNNPVATIFKIFWKIFEPILFGMTGMQIEIAEFNIGLVSNGVICLLAGILLRIFITVVMSMGSGYNLKEKIFIGLTCMAKGTVQAALGPATLDIIDDSNPESKRLADIVLMLCVLSILLIAPLGAIIIMFSGPKLLTKTEAPIEFPLPDEGGWRNVIIINETKDPENCFNSTKVPHLTNTRVCVHNASYSDSNAGIASDAHNSSETLHHVKTCISKINELEHHDPTHYLQRKKSTDSLSGCIKKPAESGKEVQSCEPPSWVRVCLGPYYASYHKLNRILCLLLIGLLTWGVSYSIVGKNVAPGGPLFSLAALAITARFAGWLVSLANMPALIGMLLSGIVLQNAGLLRIDERYAYSITNLRKIALIIILTRAGLGLDPRALKSMKITVPKINLISWTVEVGIITMTSYYFIGFPLIWSILAGSVVAAISPAVVVPCLLRLKDEGYGIAKGIPTLIIAVTGVDNAVSISIYGIVQSIMFSDDELWYQILQGPIAIVGGIGFGVVWGSLARYVPEKNDPFVVSLRVLMLLGAGMISVFGSERINLRGAGPLAVIAAAFVSSYFWQEDGWAVNNNPVSTTFKVFWSIFEPILFGLTGVQIKLNELDGNLVYISICCLSVGILLRILITIFVSIGSRLNLKEKIFIALACMAKGTVQAALGPATLDKIDQHDPEAKRLADTVLMLCVLSILLTAPLGAFIIMFFGPKLLTKTRVTIQPSAPDMPSKLSTHNLHGLGEGPNTKDCSTSVPTINTGMSGHQRGPDPTKSLN
ncbi:hypothetical protein QAD02_022313 [Eretmocerus hayati]|uniref:Uncharacterized protein n=2 Tax=Eretmocerus hayati TaxID=131215 RepID=A0ACC2PT89_9HYME|nr:hypothetical protein QAD02_022313 [Eretmocerus hayati]